MNRPSPGHVQPKAGQISRSLIFHTGKNMKSIEPE